MDAYRGTLSGGKFDHTAISVNLSEGAIIWRDENPDVGIALHVCA